MALVAKMYDANTYDSLKEAIEFGAVIEMELHGDYTDETTNKDVDVLRALCFNCRMDAPVIILEEAGTVLNIFHPSLRER